MRGQFRISAFFPLINQKWHKSVFQLQPLFFLQKLSFTSSVCGKTTITKELDFQIPHSLLHFPYRIYAFKPYQITPYKKFIITWIWQKHTKWAPFAVVKETGSENPTIAIRSTKRRRSKHRTFWKIQYKKQWHYPTPYGQQLTRTYWLSLLLGILKRKKSLLRNLDKKLGKLPDSDISCLDLN